MRTFAEFKTDIANLADRTDDTTYKNTHIGFYINLSQTTLARAYDYYTELQAIHNFSTVASQEEYMMPNDFDKPLRFKDLTNKKSLEIETEEVYVDTNIANIASATEESAPSRYRIYGTQGVQIAISTSGDTVKVKSSSSESSDIVVRIEGYIDSAQTILDYESITIPSTDPTTFVAGSKTFYKITHVSKNATSTGYVTVANSSDTTLAIIASYEKVLNHKVMKIGKIPSQVNSMRMWYKRTARDLVDDNDYPFVDSDEFIILNSYGYTLADQREGAERAQQIWSKASEALGTFLTNYQNKMGPSYQHKIVSSFAQAHRV